MIAAFFLGIGAVCLGLGLWAGLPGIPQAWLGATCLVVGVAYLLDWPGLLGKRSTGRHAAVALTGLAPFLAMTWLAWQLRRLRSEPCWNEIAPGLFLGRRPASGELPRDVAMVVDLTCELWAPMHLRALPYRCLPTLDGRAPRPEAFAALVRELAQTPGGIYVHCMAGHGRSAAVVAAVLLARAVVPTVEDAEALMKRIRPAVALTNDQRALVRAFASRRA